MIVTCNWHGERLSYTIQFGNLKDIDRSEGDKHREKYILKRNLAEQNVKAWTGFNWTEVAQNRLGGRTFVNVIMNVSNTMKTFGRINMTFQMKRVAWSWLIPVDLPAEKKGKLI